MVLVPALCDINFIFALVTDRHVHHPHAVTWLQQAEAGGAIVCRQAQLGFLRLLNNPAILKEEAMRADACWGIWRKLLTDDRFCFVAGEPAGMDVFFEQFTGRRAFTPKLWTDAYLAAFAKAAGLSVVTFDIGFRQFAGLKTEILASA